MQRESIRINIIIIMNNYQLRIKIYIEIYIDILDAKILLSCYLFSLLVCGPRGLLFQTERFVDAELQEGLLSIH